MRRKSTKNTRAPNSDEKAFQSWVMNDHGRCIVTGRQDIELHHMYGSTAKNNKLLIGHYAVIPLCYDLHRGVNGYHTLGSKAWTSKFDLQCNLFHKLICIYELLGSKYGEFPEDIFSSIMDMRR